MNKISLLFTCLLTCLINMSVCHADFEAPGQARHKANLAMTNKTNIFIKPNTFTALTATTGTFGGAITSTTFGGTTITSTVAALVMGTAAGTAGGLIETNTTASTAVAPIQISPAVEWRGTVWDTASRTHNWRTYANPMFDATTATSRLATQYGYNGLTEALQTDRMSLGSEGTLDVFGTTLGAESLTNGVLTAGTSWTRTGDMALSANAATYTHSTAVGTLSQASGTMAIAGVANRWYAFTYTTSATVAGVTAYIDTTFAQKRIYLNLVAGVYTVYFKAAAAPGNFTIICTSTAGGAVTLDTFSLKEVQSGDIIANGQFTGGGVNGIKINGAGNVGIGSTNPGAKLDVVGDIRGSNIKAATGTPYVCVDVNGTLVKSAIACVGT